MPVDLPAINSIRSNMHPKSFSLAIRPSKRYSQNSNLPKIEHSRAISYSDVFYLNKVSLMTLREKLNSPNLEKKTTEIMMEFYSVLENMRQAFMEVEFKEFYDQIWEIMNSMTRIVNFYRDSKQIKPDEKQAVVTCVKCEELSLNMRNKVKAVSHLKQNQSNPLGGVFLYRQNYQRFMEKGEKSSEAGTKKNIPSRQELAKEVMMELNDRATYEEMCQYTQMENFIMRRKKMPPIIKEHKNQFKEIETFIVDLEKKVESILNEFVVDLNISLIKGMDEASKLKFQEMIDEQITQKGQRVQQLNETYSKTIISLKKKIEQLVSYQKELQSRKVQVISRETQTDEIKEDVYQIKMRLIQAEQEKLGFEKLYSQVVQREKSIFKQWEMEVNEKEKQIGAKQEMLWKKNQEVNYVKQRVQFLQEIIAFKDKDPLKAFKQMSDKAKKFFVGELMKNELISAALIQGKTEKKSVIIDHARSRGDSIQKNKLKNSRLSSLAPDSLQFKIKTSQLQELQAYKQSIEDQPNSSKSSSSPSHSSADNREQKIIFESGFIKKKSRASNRRSNSSDLVPVIKTKKPHFPQCEQQRKQPLVEELQSRVKARSHKNLSKFYKVKSTRSINSSLFQIENSQTATHKHLVTSQQISHLTVGKSVASILSNSLMTSGVSGSNTVQNSQKNADATKDLLALSRKDSLRKNSLQHKLQNSLNHAQSQPENVHANIERRFKKKTVKQDDSGDLTPADVTSSTKTPNNLLEKSADTSPNKINSKAKNLVIMKKARGKRELPNLNTTYEAKSFNDPRRPKQIRQESIGAQQDQEDESHPYDDLNEPNGTASDIQAENKNCKISTIQTNNLKQLKQEESVQRLIGKCRTKKQFLTRISALHAKSCLTKNCGHLNKYLLMYNKIKENAKPAMKIPVQSLNP